MRMRKIWTVTSCKITNWTKHCFVPFLFAFYMFAFASGCSSQNNNRQFESQDPTIPTIPTNKKTLKDQPNLITNIGKMPEMAKPILRLFRAVKEQNPNALKQVFSSRIKKKFRERNRTWSDVLFFYQRKWKKDFGDWKMRYIHFDSTIWSPKEPNKGRVGVSFKPPRLKKPLKIVVPVVKEGEEWRLDED